MNDHFGARSTFKVGGKEIGIYRLSALTDKGIDGIDRLPYSIRVLLESVLRNCDGKIVQPEDVEALAKWNAKDPAKVEIPYKPSRVVLQDLSLIHI